MFSTSTPPSPSARSSPSPTKGGVKLPCAFVELKPGTSATKEEIIGWCRETAGSLQGPTPRRIHRRAAHADRQDPEVQVAGFGKEA